MIDALMDFLCRHLPRWLAFAVVLVGPAILIDLVVMLIWSRWLGAGLTGPIVGFALGVLWCLYVLITLGTQLKGG